MDGNIEVIVFLIYMIILSLVNVTYGSFIIPESASINRLQHGYSGTHYDYELADSTEVNWKKKVRKENITRFSEPVLRDKQDESVVISNWGFTGYFSIDAHHAK